MISLEWRVASTPWLGDRVAGNGGNYPARSTVYVGFVCAMNNNTMRLRFVLSSARAKLTGARAS